MGHCTIYTYALGYEASQKYKNYKSKKDKKECSFWGEGDMHLFQIKFFKISFTLFFFEIMLNSFNFFFFFVTITIAECLEQII